MSDPAITPAAEAAALEDLNATLVPCPGCEKPGELYKTRRLTYAVECSEMGDCPQWPMTKEHSTPLAAADAWNKGEVK